jgi:hypothetical protein
MTRTIGLLGLLWVVLAAVIMALPGGDWLAYKGVVDHGRRTTARVVALSLSYHNTVECAYEANGRRFDATQQLEPPNPDSSSAHMGESVVVYYDARNPASVVFGAPAPVLENETEFMLTSAVLFPTLVVLRLYFVLRKRRGNDPVGHHERASGSELP